MTINKAISLLDNTEIVYVEENQKTVSPFLF